MEQEINEILSVLIDEDIIEYKCFDLLKEKLKENHHFREIIKIGIKAGLVSKFPRDLFDRVCEQNIRARFEPVQLFIDGANIGSCTTMSKLVSYSLDNCDICGGTLDILEGTKNSVAGSHTWISYRGIAIDTSLMISVNEKFTKQFGYIEENRYNPNIDPIYRAAKDYATDKDLRRKK